MQAMKKPEARGVGGASFLLAQVGAHAAQKFAERLKPLGFAPYHAGLLRMLAHSPGISQQDLAGSLRMHASNLVRILDELEQRGLLERRASGKDRRVYALYLTDRGKEDLTKIAEVAREHGRALLAVLSEGQRMELARLLEAIAENQGLLPGVHPGFTRMGRRTQRGTREPNKDNDL
jgi:DNA-binding MarR family transcriptional regulator